MNSDDVSRLISNLVQNPDALKGLMGSLGAGGSAPGDAPPAQGSPDASMQSIMSALSRTDDRRITLLNALRPYLSPQRAGGIDRAIRILQLTKLSEMMRNERD